MALLKYAAKLSKMSRAEVTFRLKQKMRNRREVARWKRHTDSNLHALFFPSWIVNWDFKKCTFPLDSIKFFGLAENSEKLRNEYLSKFPEMFDRCVEEADRLVNHQFHLLGLEVKLPDPISWNRNPQTGKDYPKDHHSTIDTMDPAGYGDVKYVWELNRHQFFIEVAKAYFLTGEEKYATKIWDWFSSWVEDNPYKLGINNTSVLEHSIRIYAWIWAYFFTKESSVWTIERRESLARQLLLEGCMIEENLSFYYSPYNHLIGELAALAFLGTVFSSSPQTEMWRDKYWQEMERQLPKQFHPDGFTVEQASYYHHFTVGFYLMGALLREQNGLPVSAEVYETMEKALGFSMDLTRPDGQLPMLGDIDSARSIYFYRPETMWNLRPFLSLGAVLFKRQDMKFVAGGLNEEVLWLLGTEGVKSFDNLETNKPGHTSTVYTKSGYYIMRDGWQSTDNYCCFDCGEIAHGVFKDGTPSAAHGHGDILSFDLCINGQPLVIDPGFFTYFGPLEWHRYFRSTHGHNTIEVNNAGQANHESRIAWSNVSSPKLDHWISTDEIDFVSGEIDRFANLNKDVFHRRSILFRKGCYFLIMDEITGQGGIEQFQIKSTLHFLPGELSYSNNQLNYNNTLISLFALPEKVQVTIETGGEQPHQGWMAQGYGQKSPAPVLAINGVELLPTWLGMLFPVASTRATISKFTQEKVSENISCYCVKLAEGEERVYFNPHRTQFCLSWQEHIKTDALCAIEKKSDESTFENYFFKSSHLISKDSDLGINFVGKTLAGIKINIGKAGKPIIEILGEK